jgi:RimJ/RimL family protein N-acetyltransferase
MSISKIVQIKTQRLLLAPHRKENYREIKEWESDPELLYFNDSSPPKNNKMSLSEAQTYLYNIMKNNSDSFIHYAIYLNNESNTFIGYGAIAFIDHFNLSCKLSIVIGAKNEWGKGFAKEALHEIIKFCFLKLKMNRVGAEIYAFNERSIKLFEGLHFKREGIIREAVNKKGKWEDEIIFGLLKSEWSPH